MVIANRLSGVDSVGQRDCNGWSYQGVKGAGIPGPYGPKQPDGSTSCPPPELIGTCNKKWPINIGANMEVSSVKAPLHNVEFPDASCSSQIFN